MEFPTQDLPLHLYFWRSSEPSQGGDPWQEMQDLTCKTQRVDESSLQERIFGEHWKSTEVKALLSLLELPYKYTSPAFMVPIFQKNILGAITLYSSTGRSSGILGRVKAWACHKHRIREWEDNTCNNGPNLQEARCRLNISRKLLN